MAAATWEAVTVKIRLVVVALMLVLSVTLAAQVPLRPPADTSSRPTWPGLGAVVPKPRHAHPLLGAAVGAAVGGGVGYLVWRPCTGWVGVLCRRGETVALGAGLGAILGWAVGSAITTEDRAPAPTEGVRQGPPGLGRVAPARLGGIR